LERAAAQDTSLFSHLSPLYHFRPQKFQGGKRFPERGTSQVEPVITVIVILQTVDQRCDQMESCLDVIIESGFVCS